MTPLDTLAKRIEDLIFDGSGDVDAENIAREALRWVEEQMPSDVEIIAKTKLCSRVEDCEECNGAWDRLDTLLALLRERLGAGKGAGG